MIFQGHLSRGLSSPLTGVHAVIGNFLKVCTFSVGKTSLPPLRTSVWDNKLVFSSNLEPSAEKKTVAKGWSRGMKSLTTSATSMTLGSFSRRICHQSHKLPNTQQLPGKLYQRSSEEVWGRRSPLWAAGQSRYAVIKVHKRLKFHSAPQNSLFLSSKTSWRGVYLRSSYEALSTLSPSSGHPRVDSCTEVHTYTCFKAYMV